MAERSKRLSALVATAGEGCDRSYAPFTLNVAFISRPASQSAEDTKMGKVGAELDLAKGNEAARLCALNILAQAKAALRDLDRIVQLLRLNGFVNAAPGFADHPKVLNGASDLMVEILGNKGVHTRIAVGCASLPLNAAVEVDAIFAVD
jgi:enamine deaminase RidA (YjgF/YER057c/UK114 family)